MGIFFFDQLLYFQLNNTRRNFFAVFIHHAFGKEPPELNNALGRMCILAINHPRHGRKMHADILGNIFEHHRLDVLRSEEHTSELQSLRHLVCRLLLEKKKNKTRTTSRHATTNPTRVPTAKVLCALLRSPSTHRVTSSTIPYRPGRCSAPRHPTR